MPAIIDHSALQELSARGAQLVEVLPAGEYAEMHLPGAVSLPLKELNADGARRLDPARPVIVYCWDYQ
ncbi:Rhodanese-like domain [Gaiella occulta]|uniref:Rhodanese-like domain n=1 Tax=Gaiella occulta TaxID=1002870 RepID=A0A7M2YZJ4_9ACTN|nr:rhodanese-like domain-containing protein [Gaiella occulta]RDI75439.1 Rhodanese-like domain [Gaiella occulta]